MAEERASKKVMVPPVEVFTEMCNNEPLFFPDPKEITVELRDYVYAQQMYRYFFGLYLIGQSGLDRLDQRIKDHGYHKKTVNDYYEQYDTLGLDFFLLRSVARVDRLGVKEFELFTKRSLTDEEKKSCFQIVKDTYHNVMCISSEKPNMVIESRMTVHRDYAVEAGSLVLLLRSAPSFDENGMLISKEEEQKRINVFSGFKAQVEPILKNDLGMTVHIITELF